MFARLVDASSSNGDDGGGVGRMLLSPQQCAALIRVLTEVWREGDALPQPQPQPQPPPPTTTTDSTTADTDSADSAADAATTEATTEEPALAAAADVDAVVQEYLAAAVGLPVGACRVSALHGCWHRLLSAMLAAGNVRDVLAILDGAAAATLAAAAAPAAGAAAVDAQQAHGQAPHKQQQQQEPGPVVLPLRESEAQQLVSSAAGSLGPAGQAVLGLLMPYTSCQHAAMQLLLTGQLLVRHDEPWAGQLLLLVLLRQQTPALAAAAAAGGGAARRSGGGSSAAGSTRSSSSDGGSGGDTGMASVVKQQLYHLYDLLLQPVVAAPAGTAATAWAYLTLLFPHAVAQLCLASDYAGAAALVAAKMRPCHALSTLQGLLLFLQRYLEVAMQGRLQQKWLRDVAASSSGNSSGPAVGTGGVESVLWMPRCEAWLANHAAPVAHQAHVQLNGAVRERGA